MRKFKVRDMAMLRDEECVVTKLAYKDNRRRSYYEVRSIVSNDTEIVRSDRLIKIS